MMAKTADILTSLTIPCLILLYLTVAPYTKIEESFTIQATHDFLVHGFKVKNVGPNLGVDQYDHIVYPELHPVPRTFVAPLILASIASPFMSIVQGIDAQILVRAILGMYNAFCLLAFRNSIRRAYGRTTANWFSVFQACQFHIMFYASRTLPNFIPFGLATVATGLLIEKATTPLKAQRQFEPALAILTVLGIVFRSELAVYLGAHTIYGFLRGRLSISGIILTGLGSAILGLLITVPLDSYMWSKYPEWPELTSFLFNIYEGKSIEWGVSPWYYYFVNAAPKIQFNPILLTVCIPLALVNPSLRSSSIDLLVPNLAYIAIYSFQPHKEWRFIVYAIPSLTAAGAQGASWIWTRRSKSTLYGLLSIGLVLSCLSSLVASFLFLSISSLNYPGAQALHQLQVLADGTKPVINVHMDVLTAQTGATLFLQLPSTTSHVNGSIWKFDKADVKTGDGTLILMPDFWARFDYALAEKAEKCIGAWEEMATIEGLDGIGIVRPGDAYEKVESISEVPWWHSQRALTWGQAPWSPITSRIWYSWRLSGNYMRKHITRGWWIDVKMKPMIKVLKRIPGDVVQDRILAQQ